MMTLTTSGSGSDSGSGSLVRGGVALAVAAALLVACGVVAPGKKVNDARREALRVTAEKASQLSVLQQQAYNRNTTLQFSAAEADYRETFRLARELFPTDPAKASSLLLHLALNKSNLGQFESAEDLFDKSRTTVEEFGKISEAAKPDLFYAQHLMNQRQFAAAEEVARTAIQSLDFLLSRLDESGNAPESEIRLVERADGTLFLNQSQANRANAREDVRRGFNNNAIVITERQRLELQHAHANYIIARSMQAQNRPEAEIDALIGSVETELAQIPQVFGRWMRAEIASLRADVLLATGNPLAGVQRLDGAIDLLRRFEMDSRPEALLLFKKGEFLLEAEDARGARSAYRKAIQIIKSDDQGLEFEQAQTIIDGLLQDVQSGADGAAGELFEVMQKVRSSATAQTVAQLSARLASGDSERAKALRQIQNLERQINVVSARFDRLEADPEADLHVKRVTESKLSDLENQQVAARAALGDSAASYDQLIDAVIPLEQAQSLLRDGEVVAIIQLGEEKGLVAVMTNGSFDAYDIVLNNQSAEEAVRALRAPIDGEFLIKVDLEESYGMFDTLFGPVKNRVRDAEHLVIVPSGPLLSLPFNILTVEEYEDEIEIVDQAYFDYSKVKWLGAQTGITTGVSISSFFLGRRVDTGSRGSKPFLGFGDFKEFGSNTEVVDRILSQRELPESCGSDVQQLGVLGELAGTRDELVKVQSVLGVEDDDVVLGDKFTDSYVKSAELDDYRVLHFATHGVLGISPDCLPEPGLITSIADDGDSLLEASEIVNLNLDADLVVMSACDTGAGAGQAAESQIGFRGVGGSYAAGGESLNGLARGFFFAGARNVLSTHWSVDDIATQTLMVSFYEQVAKDANVSIADAMRKSQTALVDGAELSHPFFWAPFAIIGDGARTLTFDQQAEAAEEEGAEEGDVPAADAEQAPAGDGDVAPAADAEQAPDGAAPEAPAADAEQAPAAEDGESATAPATEDAG